MDRTSSHPRQSWFAIRAFALVPILFVFGCSSFSKSQLNEQKDVAKELRQQVRNANDDVARLERKLTEAEQQKGQFDQRLASEKEVQTVLEQRLENLRRENDRLHGDLTGAVMHAASGRGPAGSVTPAGATALVVVKLPPSFQRSLVEFSKKHPEAEFVSAEKVIRMRSSQAFLEGGDRIRTEMRGTLKELAGILNQPGATEWNLSIVGHTAGENAVSAHTKEHPTDWHLAAHQAIAVQQFLEENGVGAERANIVSYAGQQPLVDGKDDVAKDKNARLEIYLLPPDGAGER